MDPGLIWILAGLVLLGGELVLPGIFLLWIGLAAIGTGLLMLVAVPSFGVTVLVFILLLAAGIAVGLKLRPRSPPPRPGSPPAGNPQPGGGATALPPSAPGSPWIRA